MSDTFFISTLWISSIMQFWENVTIIIWFYDEITKYSSILPILLSDILELKGESKENFDELKEKGEFEEEIVNVEKQAKRLIESAIDKEQYNGIIGNY